MNDAANPTDSNAVALDRVLAALVHESSPARRVEIRQTIARLEAAVAFVGAQRAVASRRSDSSLACERAALAARIRETQDELDTLEAALLATA